MSMSTLWSTQYNKMSHKIATPVRPTPAEQWTRTGGLRLLADDFGDFEDDVGVLDNVDEDVMMCCRNDPTSSRNSR
jgi:hypothetical protein